ncbi:MAG TPA: HNH endonuclease [Woeseiaceae bacterium]|nr:HNH endonuclease [Woeseiaceae bacterium]
MGAKRRSLTQDERKQIAAKTGSRCHICGGPLEPRWHADHVLAHSGGGRHSVDNYLPAHATCNNYRWDYSSTEFAEILKLGVFFRTAIEKGDAHADKLARSYLAKERQRQRRMR